MPTVHKNVQANFLLEFDAGVDLLLDEGVVLLSGVLALL